MVARNLRFCSKFVLLAAKILVRNFIEEEEAKKSNSVSLSNDTMRHRIHAVSDDISDQVTTTVRASKYRFARQLNESTEVTNSSQCLSVHIRFTENDVVKINLLIRQRAKIILTPRKNFS